MSPHRNPSEQEHSIKARSNELFESEGPSAGAGRASRPFREYLKETPARPFSPLIQAMFWSLGAIVLLLFLAAIWRLAR